MEIQMYEKRVYDASRLAEDQEAKERAIDYLEQKKRFEYYMQRKEPLLWKLDKALRSAVLTIMLPIV